MTFLFETTIHLSLDQRQESALEIDVLTHWVSRYCMNLKVPLSQTSCLFMGSVEQAVRLGARTAVQAYSGLANGSLKSADYAMLGSRRSGTTHILHHFLRRKTSSISQISPRICFSR